MLVNFLNIYSVYVIRKKNVLVHKISKYDNIYVFICVKKT